ncbi:hypothetical protein OROGR_011825 [Orobanche gracilis]
MASSLIFRGFISPGMFRSGGVGPNYSTSFLNFANPCFKRTAMSVRVSSQSAAPWLMLPPAVDRGGSIVYQFHSLAKKENEPIQYTSNIDAGDHELDVEFVGSSHGWLALYNRNNSDLFLSNPISDRHIKLPSLRSLGTDRPRHVKLGLPSLRSLGAADRLILTSDAEDEEGCLALMTSGPSRRLAFCSLRRSNEWTLFGGDHNLTFVYSSRYERLFCIREEEYNKYPMSFWAKYEKYFRTSLEGWVVGENNPNAPHLDWVMELNEVLDFDDRKFKWPGKLSLKKVCRCHRMKYLVCAEHSGELFLVVRHINPRAGPQDSVIKKIILGRYRGCDYYMAPYKTFDFDVFKIDFVRGEVTLLEGSLGGLAMFVGINQPFAIVAAEVDGVRPDCVYFTDENWLVEPTRLERTTYGGHDNGVFDYKNKEFYPCCDLYPVEYEKISKILPLPLWFTQTTIT